MLVLSPALFLKGYCVLFLSVPLVLNLVAKTGARECLSFMKDVRPLHAEALRPQQGLDSLCVCVHLRHALDIREHYERKLERANNLYMELNAVMLQLELKEKELQRYE